MSDEEEYSDIEFETEEEDDENEEDEDEILELDDDDIDGGQTAIQPAQRRRTLDYITIFEFARVIATRVRELEEGREPYLQDNIPDTARAIAMEEYQRGHLGKYIIRRPIGASYEEWRVSELKPLPDMRILP